MEFLCKKIYIVSLKSIYEPKKTAIIIGVGPAGLAAAYELFDKTYITPD